MSTLLFIILTTLVLSAFFSGMEIAFLSANRLHIELESKKGNFPFNLISFLVKRPARFIATMLVGNNIALVLYGLYMPEALNPLIGGIENAWILLLVQTALSTIVILFLAEYIPKAYFNANANESLRWFALPSVLFYGLFYPIVSFMMLISNGLLKLFFKKELDEDQPVFSKVDLDHFIQENTTSNRDSEEVDHEIEIFQNALDFSEQKAREMMIPRTEIMAVPVETSIEKLKSVFTDHGYSKVLIFEENMDNLIGYVHAYELFKKPSDIRSVLRPVSFIPESMTADQLLNHFTKEKRNIAIVIDEFGGTSGMITLEDVVEEIFGEIEDEHDSEDLKEVAFEDGSFVFSARLEIDHLNDNYDLKLPESETYSTLGGLLTSRFESIPEPGEMVVIEDLRFKITKGSSNRIDEVQVKRLESE
ncbi:MAG: hemolysin family protein [Schleiferiaceae bacterium]